MITSKDPSAAQSLRAVDFQLLDGHTILPISTFVSTSAGSARPLLLWFVAQCPEPRFESTGSGFMLGKTDTLTPQSEKTGGRVLYTWSGDYGKELERIIGELYARYQLGFLPPAQNGRQHEQQIKSIEEARKRLKSVDFRYPSAYMASSNALRSVPASQTESDPALLNALKSSGGYNEIDFGASGRIAAASQPVQFQLYIDPRSLRWKAKKGGDRAASLTMAVAGLVTQGQILGRAGKDSEAQQTKADLSKSSPGAAILTLDFAVPEEADYVRSIVRASGHLWCEMPASEIRKPR